jgi:hypothetical protein
MSDEEFEEARAELAHFQKQWHDEVVCGGDSEADIRGTR